MKNASMVFEMNDDDFQGKQNWQKEPLPENKSIPHCLKRLSYITL
jgi:hypothetical protein